MNTVLHRSLLALVCLSTLLLGGCATWKPIRKNAAWTLYVKDGQAVDVPSFEAALEPAFATVQEHMGPFRQAVRVHAWDGNVDLQGGNGGVLRDSRSGEMHDVPGIGPARVRAFHVRGGGRLFSPTGVFLGTAEVGTAVHELVHARLAELSYEVPLWFEEGLASLLGDGAWFEGRWVVDGLACWPLRELREQRLGHQELARLLEITARDDYDARENLLVHFVGWAIVFDLFRSDPAGPWTRWLAEFERGAELRGRTAQARYHLERTLDDTTHHEWLSRLGDPDPGVRLAAAKGTWKLRSESTVDLLLEALENEAEPEVRFGLAINALLTSGETSLGRSRWRRLMSTVFPTLRQADLPEPAEQSAAQDLYRAMRYGSRRRGRSQEAIESLARFWEE